ncbi:DUF2283 domain-containing protein [Methanobrevibacter sp. OttesenSCG-928-I08]|nr:DUF2283 domain-containing protein [Methanobrevibacter sp. OttesenSCG-928-I08]
MESYELNYNYDYKYDLLDMTIKDNFKFKESVELDDGVILDFDENNRPISLEIISASKVLSTDKKNLINPTIEMFINVSDEKIHVEVIFAYELHNKSADISIEKDIVNDYNIPAMETTLVSS